MTQLNIPYNFQNQTTSDASQVDQNFNAVANVVNGKLADDNITPNSLTSASVATEGIVASDTKNLVYAQDLFSSSFIISGGVCTKDGTNANQVDVTSPILGWVKQSDNTFRRLSVAVTNYKTTIASTTYYLDLGADGIVYWAQTHPSVNYATIATVTSDASSNVNVITDTRSLTNVPLSNYLRTDAGAPNPQTVANPVSFSASPTFPSWLMENALGAGKLTQFGVGNTVNGVNGDLFNIAEEGVSWVLALDHNGNFGISGNITAANLNGGVNGTWTPTSGSLNVAVGTVINVATAPGGANMFHVGYVSGYQPLSANPSVYGTSASNGNTSWVYSASSSYGGSATTTSSGPPNSYITINDGGYQTQGYFRIYNGYFQFVTSGSPAANTNAQQTYYWGVR